MQRPECLRIQAESGQDVVHIQKESDKCAMQGIESEWLPTYSTKVIQVVRSLYTWK